MQLIGLLSLRSYRTQDHLHRDGSTLSGLGLPASVNSQDSVTQTWPQTNLVAVFPH